LLGKILNITSLQNPIIKDLTKIIRSNNQKEIKSFICEGNFFLKSAFENKWEIQTLVINSNISFSTEITKIINDCILKNVKVVSVDKKILSKLSNNNKFECLFPDISLCSDNAAMIALVGLEKFKKNLFNELNFKANPRWQLDEKAKFLKGSGIKL